MAKLIGSNRSTPILQATQLWAQRCLIEDGSILGGGVVWTAQNLDALHRHFVLQPDAGTGSFYQKLQGQLQGAPEAAVQLMTELLWALFLFPSNILVETKREALQDVWSWSGAVIDADHPMLADTVLAGIGSAGMGVNTNRWRELNYLIGLFTKLKQLDESSRREVLGDYGKFVEWITQVPQDGNRQYRHMLRYLLFPERVERMSSNGDRKRVLAAFDAATPKQMRHWTDQQFDDALWSLRQKLEQEHGTQNLDFYVSPLREVWKPDDLPVEEGEVDVGLDHDAGAGVRVREPASSYARAPRNQILFGPPGTGKTYHSVNAALEVLDPDCLAANPGAAGRKALKQRFDELVQARRIRFITFHQSFSYEDFVEGLRADNDEDGNLRYRVEPGVFKSICDDARGAAQVASAVGIRDGARIWKISIEGTGASTTRDHGFKHGEARIGWGEVGDLHDERLAERPDYQALGSNDRNTLHAFSSEIQPGDVMLCIGSATQAQAIGVVQGDYQFEANVPSGVRADFNNVLPVRWLATGLALNLRELNGGIRFTLKTVYELSRFGWPELAEAIEAAGIELGGASRTPARQPLDHVLIIDEINRGNVSRIFGELITLIEPSKRAGADEQLEVVLPYSKKSFAVPANVHLIGTMNTADRSLAGLDIALRRRFEFVEMPARPELLAGVVVDGIDIETMLTVMNQRIEALLDRDHHLGHAYFLPLKSDRSLMKLATIFRHQILPLLQEYFFEDWERIRWVLNDQHKRVAGHCFVVPPAHSVPGLFGGTAEVPVDARLWELAPAALGRRESYLGIIDANGGQPLLAGLA